MENVVAERPNITEKVHLLVENHQKIPIKISFKKMMIINDKYLKHFLNIETNDIKVENNQENKKENLINTMILDSSKIFSYELSLSFNQIECLSLQNNFIRNISFVHHLPNLYYLDLAYEALPQDVYENTTFNDVEIMYKKEAKLYDKLKCLYSKMDNDYYVVIKSEDEQTLHAIVKLS